MRSPAPRLSPGPACRLHSAAGLAMASLLAALLGACAGHGPNAQPHTLPQAPSPTAAARDVPLPMHSLLLPAHLPHLMQVLEDDKVPLDPAPSAAQRQALASFARERVRPNLLPRLKEARQLEQEIAAAVLAGQATAELAPRLDRLQQLKREVAEIHIGCIQNMRQVLSAEQYAAVQRAAAMHPH